MKKILITSLITAVALSGSFAQERVTFEGNTYSLDYVEEFDDENNLKIFSAEQPCGPGTNWWNTGWDIPVYDRRTIEWHCGKDCHPQTKVIQKAGGYGAEYVVEDGSLKIMSSSRRIKQIENPSAYKYYDSLGMYQTPSIVGSGTYIEIKFKTPKKQGFNFTIFANSPHHGHGGKKPMSVTSKDYMMRSLDFMELTTGSSCPKNTVKPHDGATVAIKDATTNVNVREPGNPNPNCAPSKDYNKPFKISGPEWFDEWHIFQAIVEDTYIKAWIDGIQYCYDSWEYYGELPEQCMELIFGNDQVGHSEPAESPIKYKGSEPYTATSYIDYVKVGQKVKE